MSSLYIGKLGRGTEVFEVHAFTKDLPFRNYKIDNISDSELFDKLIHTRFEVLEGGNPIYCTAVNPDIHNKTEINPHDLRPGTVHIAVLNSANEIVAGSSLAVDYLERDKGDPIGLPLENRWKSNGYPKGDNLDNFRTKYLRINYNLERDILAGELVELYRHFKIDKKRTGNIAPRLAVYYGAYNLLKRDAHKNGQIPSWIWVFDAIPAYFNLYRYAGAAVLRESSINENSVLISPGKRDIKKDIKANILLYENSIISRNIKVPIPKKHKRGISFSYQEVAFLDGVIDIIKLEKSICKHPLYLKDLKCKGINFSDLFRIRACLSTVGSKTIADFHKYNFPANFLTFLQKRFTKTSKIQNSEVGALNTRRSKIQKILFNIKDY